jgi:hypothetical protein
MKSPVLLSIAIIGALLAFGQIKPDVSGTWKMNPSRSKLSAPNNLDNLAIKFEQKDSILAETLTSSDGGSEQTFSLKYTLDGQESEQTVDGIKSQTSARWEGETLVLVWKIEGEVIRRQITLSADGKMMTMVVRHTRQSGETNEMVILDRQ